MTIKKLNLAIIFKDVKFEVEFRSVLQSLKALKIIDIFIGHCKSLKKALEKDWVHPTTVTQDGEESGIILSISYTRSIPKKWGLVCLCSQPWVITIRGLLGPVLVGFQAGQSATAE